MHTDATVFLVDDDEASLRSTRWLLESEGFAVETYASATEYLDAYDPQKPGCLVLDIRMPEMDGLELQERLVSAGEHIPIIFVTAYADVPTCVRAMRAGAVDFLEKPVDGQLLLKRIRCALEADSHRRSQGASRAEIETRIKQLSPREREVAKLLHEGKSIKCIAAQLGISVRTALKHRVRIMEKLGRDSDGEIHP